MNTPSALPVILRRTLDGFSVSIDGGALCHGGGSFTRHAPLTTVRNVLVLAEAVSLFARAEMPSLAGAAAKLSRRGELSLWPLVEEAARLSHRAGTLPADMPRPERSVKIAVWSASDLAARAAGFVVCPSGRRRVTVTG